MAWWGRCPSGSSPVLRVKLAFSCLRVCHWVAMKLVFEEKERKAREVVREDVSKRLSEVHEDVSRRFSEFRARIGGRGGGCAGVLEGHSHVEDGAWGRGLSMVMGPQGRSGGRRMAKADLLLRQRPGKVGPPSCGWEAAHGVQDPGTAESGDWGGGGLLLARVEGSRCGTLPFRGR